MTRAGFIRYRLLRLRQWWAARQQRKTFHDHGPMRPLR